MVIIPLIGYRIGFQFFRSVKIKSSGFIFMGIGSIFAAMNGFEWLSLHLRQLISSKNLHLLMREHQRLHFLIGVFSRPYPIEHSNDRDRHELSMQRDVFRLKQALRLCLAPILGHVPRPFLQASEPGTKLGSQHYAHMWLNIAGALLVLPLIHLLADAGTAAEYKSRVCNSHIAV